VWVWVDYRPTLSTLSHSTNCRSISCPKVDRGVECRSILDQDIGGDAADSVGRVSVEYRPTYRPTYSTDILDRHPGRHLGERSTDTGSSISRHPLQVGRPSVATIGPYLVGMSVYTRRHVDRYVTISYLRHIDRLSVVYRSTFGGILCIVNRLFC